jgi:hypothetical protein
MAAASSSSHGTKQEDDTDGMMLDEETRSKLVDVCVASIASGEKKRCICGDKYGVCMNCGERMVTCGICRNAFGEDEPKTYLETNCISNGVEQEHPEKWLGHIFHLECLFNWFKQKIKSENYHEQEVKLFCPLCTHDLGELDKSCREIMFKNYKGEIISCNSIDESKFGGHLVPDPEYPNIIEIIPYSEEEKKALEAKKKKPINVANVEEEEEEMGDEHAFENNIDHIDEIDEIEDD